LKRIAELEAEVTGLRAQLTAAQAESSARLVQIHELAGTIAAMDIRLGELRHDADVLAIGLTHPTCRASIFGFRIPCTVVRPE
jgi:hypothetical protein